MTQWVPNFTAPILEAGGCSNLFLCKLVMGLLYFPFLRPTKFWLFQQCKNNHQIAHLLFGSYIHFGALYFPLTSLKNRKEWIPKKIYFILSFKHFNPFELIRIWYVSDKNEVFITWIHIKLVVTLGAFYCFCTVPSWFV